MLLFIFKSMLVCSLIGTVLIMIMGLLRPLTERFFSSSWHYFVGVFIMLIMIFPIRIAVPENIDDPHMDQSFYEEKNDKIDQSYPLDKKAENQALPAELHEAKLHELITAAAYIWAVGALVIFIKKELSYILFLLRIFNKTEKVTNIDLFDDLKMPIRFGKCVPSPIIAGIIFPTLFLPDIPLSDEEIKAIISHEKIHLQRRDLIAKKIVGFVKCIHFFNPFVYHMVKKIDIYCEISCDLAATKKMNREEKQSYMMSILSLSYAAKIKTSSFSAGILSGKEILKRRFFKIKNREKINKKTKLISVFAALVLLTSSVCISGVLAGELKKPERKEFAETTSEHTAKETETENGNSLSSEYSDEGTTQAVMTTMETVAEETKSVTLEATTIEATSKEFNFVLSTESETAEPTTEKSSSENFELKVEHSNESTAEKNIKFIFPCGEKTVSSAYGKNHNGIDFSAPGIYGKNVYASSSGTVSEVGYDDGNRYGNYVVIDHGHGFNTVYAHCSELTVKKGQQVSQGDIIAKVGSTGASTGPHLHFSVTVDGEYVDPLVYLI